MAFNRGALNLIASYGSDSSDDEVPGCKVSTKRTHKSSSSEDEDNNKHIRTRYFVIYLVNEIMTIILSVYLCLLL